MQGLVILFFLTSHTTVGEAASTYLQAKGDGMCVSTVAKGPLSKSKAIVVGFDCTDSGSWTDATPMAGKDPTTGIMFEVPGVYVTSKVDMAYPADWASTKMGSKAEHTYLSLGNPTKSATKEASKLEDGMAYTTSSYFWAEKTGATNGVTMALLNVFLANKKDNKLATVDLPMIDSAAKWITAKGVCISPADKKCGDKRAFNSPMLVTIFYGYIDMKLNWAHFTQLALPMGLCLSKGVKVYFNDDPDLNPNTVKTTTAIKSILFYVVGKKSLMYYAIDQKYTTQTWESADKPKAASEETGTVAARLYPWATESKEVAECACLMIYMAKSAIVKGRSFATMMSATTGEFAAPMTKDMVRAGNGTKATKKPTLAKVNGGEAGKTYGGKPAGGAAAKNASASSAFCRDYAAIITMATVLSMLNLAL